MIPFIEILMLIVLGFFLSYLLLLSILALIARTKTEFHTAHQKAFAVVVPAHNEELVIERTLRSLFTVDYRSELYDVIVVADNCTDRTAEIARSVGAVVYERDDASRKGKGYALRWCFDKILRSSCDYDAVVVVDADSLVSKNFLEVMNFNLDHGAKVLQAADIVLPQPGVWSPEVTRIALLLYNYVRPLGRKVLGFTAGLRGNGMCFSTEILRTVPWDAFSITEDLEYGVRLLRQGIRVTFVPEATVYARMPELAKNAETQRARWESGRIAVIKTNVGQLLGDAVRKFSLRSLDMAVELLMPAFVNMLVVSGLMFFITLILAAAGISTMYGFLLLWGIVVGMGVLHVLIGLIAAKADRSMYTAILYLPRYALWKLYLYAKLVFRGRPDEWIRTSRE
jgi:1,2-diacylglycerol 3-beta-glucosyltransferase